MASSPLVNVVRNNDTELKEMEQGNGNLHSNSQSQPLQTSSSLQNPTMIDKSLTSASNLSQLLPTGTVLAFQALSPSFTNHGECVSSNKYLTGLLLSLCFLSCIAFSFTDSLIGHDGKVYHGVATFKGFYVFNFTGSGDESDDHMFTNLQKLRIKTIDYVHAFFTAVVFLSVSFSDPEVQNCFFQNPHSNTTELLVNLPLGAAFLSSFVFMIFPTTRKGVGYTNVTHHS